MRIVGKDARSLPRTEVYRMLPKGIRLNNPGNIQKTKHMWPGEVPSSDPRFKQFATMEDGVRELYRLLVEHIKEGQDNVPELISTWAPPNENNTPAYIKAVCKLTGFAPDHPIQPTYELLQPLVHAICRVENGGDFIEPEIFQMAWKDVL